MRPIAIIYGTTTDNTKSVANKLAKLFSDADIKLLDVSQSKAADFEAYPNLILGTSTWGSGDLQDDWDNTLAVLSSANLEGKTVALFGLGDASSYPDTFVDGMGIIYEAIKDKGCYFVGQVPVDGYSFDESRAIVNGTFVGLPLDEDNESKLTDSRLSAWVNLITPLLQ